jgi:phage terminase large subunit-like protein
MKRAPVGVNAVRTAATSGAQSQSSSNAHKENHMKSKKQPTVRKLTKKITDSRQIRFGAGSAPAKLVRPADAATADSGAVRFGAGSAPASLRK